jgi:hypothetical protein
MTELSRWMFELAFASSPQSSLTWFYFLFPLIEPDWQISHPALGKDTRLMGK